MGVNTMMNDRAPDSTRPLCTYANTFKAPRNPFVYSTQVTEVATALHALNMVISASGFEIFEPNHFVCQKVGTTR